MSMHQQATKKQAQKSRAIANNMEGIKQFKPVIQKLKIEATTSAPAFQLKNANWLSMANSIIQMKKFSDKFKDSSFQSTEKSDQQIYMVYDPNTKDETVEYVGKSYDLVKRLTQHKNDKSDFSGYKSQELVSGLWTPFETATHEQYWIDQAGGKGVLKNKINALSSDKWEWFHEPDDPINLDQEKELKM